MLVSVLMYVGELLAPLGVLFSAHPTADRSSGNDNNSATMGDNFTVLIARRRVDCHVLINYPALLPASAIGFCTQPENNLLAVLEAQLIIYRSHARYPRNFIVKPLAVLITRNGPPK